MRSPNSTVQDDAADGAVLDFALSRFWQIAKSQSLQPRQGFKPPTTNGVVSILESPAGPIPVSDSDIAAVETMVKSGLPFCEMTALIVV
jgi:hypothetical protein